MFLYLSQALTKAAQAPWSFARVKGVLRPESLRATETKTRERVVPPSDDDNARAGSAREPVGGSPRCPSKAGLRLPPQGRQCGSETGKE